MANILILGNGYTGSELYKFLLHTYHTCYVVSRNLLDYHDQTKLRRFILNKDINYVINCFGFTGKPNVDEAEVKKTECWNLNVKVPLLVNNTCKSLNVNYIHISSGCIYTGYDKKYTEEDSPNFGLFNESSFYSKCKHAYETLSDYGAIIRIRMPISDKWTDRNYLKKIRDYSNLVNFKNSKTYLPDLARFVQTIIDTKINMHDIGIINFVNPDPQDTEQVVEQMRLHDIVNPEWKFVDIKSLNMKAPRSNCVLCTKKLKRLFPKFELLSESNIIHSALQNAKNN